MQRENILEIGYPRNDILINHAQNQSYINEIKANLNIPIDKKLFYMHQHGEMMNTMKLVITNKLYNSI